MANNTSLKDMFCFVTEDGKYVGVDSSSGGYPSVTDYPLGIHLWHSREDAERYRSMFPREKWILKKFVGLNLQDT